MCRKCRQSCRGIRFDFQCKKFYHDYVNSSAYAKPDIIYFFNPGFHRPGFREFDTWPRTIKATLNSFTPVVITSVSENDSLLNLQVVNKYVNEIEVVFPSHVNPYSETRPHRNFYPGPDPIIFKNQFIDILK